MRLRVALTLAFLVAPLAAQDRYPASQRPTCTDGRPRAVMLTNQTDEDDCDATNSGTAEAFCCCLDGTWGKCDAAGGVGGSTDSFAIWDLPAGTNPMADSATDTMTVTCVAPLICTGDSATDTMAFSWSYTPGPSITLDLGDDGGNDSTALAEIATSNDDYSVVTEPSADKALLNVGLIAPYRQWDPNRPPTTVGTGGFTEDWSADTASQSWAWMNQGTTTETLEMDGATVAAPTNAGNSIRARCVAAPAGTDFTLHARASGNQRSDFNAFGISLLQGTLATPTRIDTMELQSPSNNFHEFTANRWTSATAFGANHGNTTDFDETAGVTRDYCLRIQFVDSGDATTFSFSEDCRTYFAAASAVNIGANPDYVCYHVRSDDGTDAMTGHFQWVRLRTDSGRALPSD